MIYSCEQRGRVEFCRKPSCRLIANKVKEPRFVGGRGEGGDSSRIAHVVCGLYFSAMMCYPNVIIKRTSKRHRTCRLLETTKETTLFTATLGRRKSCTKQSTGRKRSALCDFYILGNNLFLILYLISFFSFSLKLMKKRKG